MTCDRDIYENIKWVTENVGPVTILVNNAGVLIENSLLNGEPEKWRQVMDTNFMGLLIATKQAVAVMKENDIDDGYIVNISSIAGHYHISLPNMNVYGASKFALTNATEVIRKELAACKSNIRITVS